MWVIALSGGDIAARQGEGAGQGITRETGTGHCEQNPVVSESHRRDDPSSTPLATSRKAVLGKLAGLMLNALSLSCGGPYRESRYPASFVKNLSDCICSRAKSGVTTIGYRAEGPHRRLPPARCRYTNRVSPVSSETEPLT